jgi:mRNA interferase RelE/StbE
MIYKLIYSKNCLKDLKKLDKSNAEIIIKWLNKNIDNCSDYKNFNNYKPLVGNIRGYFRYRIGSYRVICEIKDDKCIILALSITHRKDAYK